MSSELWSSVEDIQGQDTAGDEILSEDNSTIERIQDLLNSVVRPLLEMTERSYNYYGAETTNTSSTEQEVGEKGVIDPEVKNFDQGTLNNGQAEFEISAPTTTVIPQDSELPNFSSVDPDETNKWISPEKSKDRIYFSVPCRYSTSGCRELVNPGTASEMNHMKTCDFRPIKCFVDGCGEDVPYHSFLIHLNQHFVYPTYGAKLATSVFIRTEDFGTGGVWGPKWLSTQGRHFFLMLQRFEPSGLWASWVWMFGNESEAEEFVAQITCFKGTKCISGIYPIHPIRRNQEEILNYGNGCLLTSDTMVKTVVRLEEQLVTDMTLHVNIFLRDELKMVKEEATCCKDLTTLSESSIISTTIDSAMIQISSSVKAAFADITMIKDLAALSESSAISTTLDSAMTQISSSVKAAFADMTVFKDLATLYESSAISTTLDSAMTQISSSVKSAFAELATLSESSGISTAVDSAMTKISSSVKSAFTDIAMFVNSIPTKLAAITEADV